VSQDLVTATVSTLATTDLTAEPRKLSVFWDQMIHHAKTAEKQTELSEIACVLVLQGLKALIVRLFVLDQHVQLLALLLQLALIVVLDPLLDLELTADVIVEKLDITGITVRL